MNPSKQPAEPDSRARRPTPTLRPADNPVILPARAPLWRLLAGLAEDAWHDAIEMNDAQGAVALYCPDGLSGTSRGTFEPSGLAAEVENKQRRD
jgi:hypothetical protein